MHLKQLKLAGFKSFVDPIILTLPSALVAIVGPNGCGKSNVIDAIRWVMGESSAKNLRGEVMLDVIFNGSSSRKAIGQASVELVFDNKSKRLSGQYASFQEISVKRLLTRDGENSYFLNGVRCRRRDITDIFLGTGAGARSYSVISQGTISQFVEAKPEELRTFLEEAASVSKYKERRREAVMRMAHTEDNLARIADVSIELDKQLKRLEKQAADANYYQKLKQEESTCKAEIIALKWKHIQKDQQALEKNLLAKELDYEKYQAQSAALEHSVLLLKEKIVKENATLEKQQACFYEEATAIALLEKNIQQQRQETHQLLSDQHQLKADYEAALTQLQQDKERLQGRQTELEQIRQRGELLNQEFVEKKQAYQEANSHYTALKGQWDEAKIFFTQHEQEIKTLEVTRKHLEQRQQETYVRLEKIHREIKEIDQKLADFQIEKQKEMLANLLNQKKQDETNCVASEGCVAAAKNKVMEIEAVLRETQDALYRLKTRQTELATMLKTALALEEDTSASSLIASMTVEKPWQEACEWVLGEHLQAQIVEDIEPLLLSEENAFQKKRIFTTNADFPSSNQKLKLSDKLTGFIPRSIIPLHKIILAANINEAIKLFPFIAEDESILTPDCFWLGKGWLKTLNPSLKSPTSLIASQEELTELISTILVLNERINADKMLREEWLQKLSAETSKQTLLNKKLKESHEEVRIMEMALLKQESTLSQLQVIRSRFEAEEDELKAHLEVLVLQQAQLAETFSQNQKYLHTLQENLAQLTEEKLRSEAILSVKKEAQENAYLKSQQEKSNEEKTYLIIQQLKETIAREETRLKVCEERLAGITEQLAEINPIDDLAEKLKTRCSLHQQLEKRLEEDRSRLNDFTQKLKTQEMQIKTTSKQAQILQEKIQQHRLEWQTLKVQDNHLLMALNELVPEVDELFANLSQNVTILQCEEKLQHLVAKINALGPINLAAVAEYNSELQRKKYLEAQCEDLTCALETLMSAIEKMDKETAQQLQHAFEKVNAAFQLIFPRLFGGGSARLELSCDNLLEAGILVKANPPGKRNTNIYLLSGGEKAMTAVALVFAIFQLNPSPFCLLDEVDAPLDDVNVRQFCSLVKEMSKNIQFLIITHSKLTMAFADHLIGVTMQEPGVSRVVAVEMEQAVL